MKTSDYKAVQNYKEELLRVNAPISKRNSTENSLIFSVESYVNTVIFVCRDNEFLSSLSLQWRNAADRGGRFSEKQAYYLAKAIVDVERMNINIDAAEFDKFFEKINN